MIISQFKNIIFLFIWLSVANINICYSSSIDYFKKQDSLYQNFAETIKNTKLQRYLLNPDTLNLQILYGWGRDIGLKNPKFGFWIADTILSLAIKHSDHRAIISAHSLRAQMYQQQSDIYNSIKAYKSAIRYGEEHLDYDNHPNFDKLAINYVYLGDLYYGISDKELAKIYYQKGWKILSQITEEMIHTQDSINSYYERDYTTYKWDKLYSKLKIGIILSEDEHTRTRGLKLLNEAYNTDIPRDALIKIGAAFQIGKILHVTKDSNYSDYIDNAYRMSREAKLFDLQSKIGYFILENTEILDTILANEIIYALLYTDNAQIKYKLFKLISDHLELSNMMLSRKYLDSSFYYQELYFDKENLMNIGKLQSDIEYESKVKLTNLEKQNLKSRMITVISTTIILLILILLLIWFLYQRTKLSRKIKTQNIRLAELINSREELIGIIGHDLRNPMKGIRLATSELVNVVDVVDVKSKLIELENKTAEVESLLSNILNYAQSNIDIPLITDEEVNLSSILDSIESILYHQIEVKKLNIKKDLQIDKVKSNRFIISSALNNIISNSIKFSNKNSDIIISSFIEDSFTIFKIQDFGIGIDPENIKRIESQSKPIVNAGIDSPKGNGFGLITSISLLDKIGANLYIESKLGTGTTIHIYINN